MQHKAGGARDKGACAGILLPGKVMHPVCTQPLHQQVPGRVKPDIIKPGTGRIVAQQLRRITVRQSPELQRLRRPQLLADTGQ